MKFKSIKLNNTEVLDICIVKQKKRRGMMNTKFRTAVSSDGGGERKRFRSGPRDLHANVVLFSSY